MTSVELAREWLKLRQRVEELERENTLLHGDLQAAEAKLTGVEEKLRRRAEWAEARLAKVVKAADALLSYLQQLELLTYEPADWENPTVVEFKAALAAAKGE